MKLFEEIFRMQYELFKAKIHLMSLLFCSNDHRRTSSPHPLPFESRDFVDMCGHELHL